MDFSLFTSICFCISAFFLGMTVANMQHIKKFRELEQKVQENLDDFIIMNEKFKKTELGSLELEKARLKEIQKRKAYLN